MLKITLRDRYNNKLKYIYAYFIEIHNIIIYIYNHKIYTGQYYVIKYYHTEYEIIKIEEMKENKENEI